jgi:hypothetical protein
MVIVGQPGLCVQALFFLHYLVDEAEDGLVVVFLFAIEDFLFRRTAAYSEASLVLSLAFAQPALGALSKELRVLHLMLGAGGRIQKVGRQGRAL